MKPLGRYGLGLRREFLTEIDAEGFLPDWWEVTPENWMSIPYHRRDAFEKALSLRPAIAHGLSLSIGSTDPLDIAFLGRLKTFFERYNITHYSEHLSFTSLGGAQSYELLPLPMTESTIKRVVERIHAVQDYLCMPLILENATYYYVPKSNMSENEFITRVLEQSGAKLLLDVNNVYVNSVNHGFDPYAFIDRVDPLHVAYIHVAGHYDDEETGLLIDTHGKAVKDDVWELLEHTLKTIDVPMMIERDNYVPSLQELSFEYNQMKQRCEAVRHG